MIVGCLGNIIFAVFDGYVKTIKDMVQGVSARIHYPSACWWKGSDRVHRYGRRHHYV